jgi:protein tyrosine phosphatase
MLLSLCRLVIILSISSSCAASENISELTIFTQKWSDFMVSEEMSKKMNGNPMDAEAHQDYEFFLLDEFSDQQANRYRPYIESIDRYKECRPYLENRITLLDGTEMSASFIQIPGYHHFIATQAPFKSNRHLFWQMILENQIDQVVMVTELSEENHPTSVELAYPYWPEKIDETLILENGLTVTLIEESDLLSELEEYIQIRKFNLHHQETDRIVTHYWYRNWIDGAAPNQSQTILTLIHKVEEDKNLLGSNSPILVHCSAGIGRTGVFLTLYHLMQRKKYNHQKIDLFNFIAYLRWQRPYLVASPSQYKFCHEVHTLLYSDSQ